MPSHLKRFHTFGSDHFVTFSCYQRRRYLDDDHARSTFLNILELTRQRHHFYIFGYVVMPSHAHLLVSEPTGGYPLADIFRALKTESSRKLKGDRKQFWQRRYYDRNILTQTEFVEKLRYIHRNPVKGNLVESPEQWQWSSFCHWQTGLAGPVEVESHWTWQHRERNTIPHPHTPLIAIKPR